MPRKPLVSEAAYLAFLEGVKHGLFTVAEGMRALKRSRQIGWVWCRDRNIDTSGKPRERYVLRTMLKLMGEK